MHNPFVMDINFGDVSLHAEEIIVGDYEAQRPAIHTDERGFAIPRALYGSGIAALLGLRHCQG
jgi:hypothetical protein